ncbi:hypothetical protein EV715DRAFT_260053 [Schizophyllum commune]
MAHIIPVNQNLSPFESLDIGLLQKYLQLAGTRPETPSALQASLQISDNTMALFDGFFQGLCTTYADVAAHCKAITEAYPGIFSTLSAILDHAQSAGNAEEPSTYTEILDALKAYATASNEAEKMRLQEVVSTLVNGELGLIASLIGQAQASMAEIQKFLSMVMDQDVRGLMETAEALESAMNDYANKQPLRQVVRDLEAVSEDLANFLQSGKSAVTPLQLMYNAWATFTDDLRSIQVMMQTGLNISTPSPVGSLVVASLREKWNSLTALVYRFKEASDMQS